VTQQQVFDGAAAATMLAEWDADVRARALVRLGLHPARSPRYARGVALALLIGLHALLFVFWYASRFPLPVSQPSVVQVRLIDESAPLRPPEPAPLPRTRSMAASMLPAPPPARTAVVPSTPAPAQPLLFNPDGLVRLPSTPHFESPHAAGIARGRELLARGHNLINCRRSQFDDSPMPAEAATAAARGAHMAHLVMGNPLDPFNDVGQQQAEDAAGEHAASKRKIEEQACDWSY
jgi:hypothetical protein